MQPYMSAYMGTVNSTLYKENAIQQLHLPDSVAFLSSSVDSSKIDSRTDADVETQTSFD